MSYRNDLEAAQFHVKEAEGRAKEIELKFNNHLSTHQCIKKTQNDPKKRTNWSSTIFAIIGVLSIILLMSGIIFGTVYNYNIRIKKTIKMRADFMKLEAQAAKADHKADQDTCEAYAPIAWPGLKCQKIIVSGRWTSGCDNEIAPIMCSCFWEDGMVLRKKSTKKLCLIPPNKENNDK